MMFEAPSIRKLYERLRQAGKRVRKPTPHDGIMVFDFQDPEGNRIQVYGPYAEEPIVC